MANQIFVSPNGEDWKGKVVGNQRASVVCDTKAEAVERARDIAKNQGLELVVQNLDGTITKDEYVSKKQKLLNDKVELMEKMKDFERNGQSWLEPRFAFAKGGD
ncbi:MAG: hypothetical protein A3H70_00415 [Candidatus Komeilibacteria bacterium RIFCSPLOWO2_02_FULL_48_11]|uniref:DUF2188 domain-containing protein n=1 Tax=Candidatus Komeilibacteria bacterium RIFCSPLOWO2_02_FULL_48_11 TaxID=1798553 RepID=A0A1G2BVZ4_9BACT|nr:MAG: hypothetical protein A3H70_00415 [Candidatus Komeilibacteria bacterium RIFCSPLOWO2_02_FULL_48_11]